MKNSRHFKKLRMSCGARALVMVAAILLALEPYVFAFTQVVSKYPTGAPTISSVDMDPGAGVNTLYYGGVFGFNSAKSMSQTTSYAEISEGACVPEGTNYTFISGMEGWSGVAATGMSYMFDSTYGGGAVKAVFATRNVTAGRAYTWQKNFFYDCGQPSTISFSFRYQRGIWNFANATNNTYSVTLTKPDLTSVTLVPSTAIGTGLLAANLVNGTIAAADLSQVGTYTLKVTGLLATTNNSGAKVEVVFDDINLSKAPQTAYGSFKQDVEISSSAVPPSSGNSYTLEIRAKKASAGAENVNVWVYDGVSADTGQGLGWVNSATINNTAHTDTTWTAVTKEYYNPDYSIALTTAQYNSGNVRVRYIDATPTADSAQDTFYLDYQRVKVDQGSCVDSVTDSASDCGKCHNYGGDVTKPWPTLGMHNKHAQTESVSDCLWCHPNNGTDSAHKNGVLTIAGTKVFRSADGNLNGAPATATYNADKTCSNIACHKNLTTPAWDSVVGVGGFYQNCSRCHNSTGTKAADAAGNLNIDSAWPNDAGGGHSKHDIAFNLTEASCQSSGSCHPDNRAQHTVVGDGKVEVKMASAYASPNKVPKYIPDATNGTGTCANMACHGGQQTSRFNLASTNPIDVPTQCTKCHLAEKGDGWGTAAGMASQWNSPISGLHRGSPPTSGKSHIADYGCTQCHNEPAKHFMTTGVSNLTDTAMDALVPATDFKAAIGTVAIGSGGTRPNWTTPTTCSNTAGTTGCHAESDIALRSPATSWARKWSWEAYDTTTPANQCKNCHGHWGSFSAGVVEPHVYTNANTTLRTNLINNHQEGAGSDCATLCHGQTDTTPYVDGVSPTQSGYNHGVAMTATAKTMDINRNVNRVDNGTTIGCSNCHATTTVDNTAGPATGHAFNESGWLKLNRPDGPASGGCITCHGGDPAMTATAIGSVTGGNGSFDTAATHRHHGGGATRYGAVADEMCTVCHADSAQNMSEASATLDLIQLKNADTGATIVWNQASPNNLNVVTFCTSCHDSNGATFAGLAVGGNALQPFGDGQTVPDVGTQYNSTVTGVTHNYTYNTVPALTKARSPHGKPGLNDMKQSAEQSTYTDANPVGCQSCHPAHGSATTNPQPVITGGAEINTTTVPLRMMVAGYTEPGNCWNCHNTAGVKDYFGDVVGGGANWVGKQNSAFTYKQRNYWSRHQVLNTSFSTTSANARANADGTGTPPALPTGIACSICHDPHGGTTWTAQGTIQYQAFSLRGNWLTSPYLEDRMGDRGGAATASTFTQAGGAAIYAGPRTVSLAAYNKPSVYGFGYNVASGGTGQNGYFIDDNTFGIASGTVLASGAVTAASIAETDTQFGGLCANCHAAAVGAASGGTVANMKAYLMPTGSTGWASGKVHYTVKSWGTAAAIDKVNVTNNNDRMHLVFGTTAPTGTSPYGVQSVGYTRSRGSFSWGVEVLGTVAQKYHNFSCSKCHTPHASNLPRLLVSNCLDVGATTTSRVSKSPTVNNTAGVARAAYTYPTFATSTAVLGSNKYWAGTKPGWFLGAVAPLVNPNEAAMHCHNRGVSNVSGGGWNVLTGY